MKPTLLIGEAARLAGCSTECLRQHEAELQPIRVGDRGVRVYRRDAVEQFARERSKRCP